MSLYYKQNFTTPISIYSEVKEELRSYFSSGILDDMMFSKWTEDCLKKFRKSAFRIEETILDVKDHSAELPCDFNAVREAWMCTVSYTDPIQDASAEYYQKDCRVDIPQFDSCHTCYETETCTTDYLVTHKITNTAIFSFRRTFLLRPGNINAAKYCENYCPNLNSQSANTFDIHNKKFITSFAEGKVHLLYYSDSTDEQDYQLVPDSFWVKDYIKKYIIYMCFRQLCNSVTDETYLQVERKKEDAKQEQSEAFITAEIELKKQTSSEKIRQVGVFNRKNDMYKLPGDYNNLY